VKTLEEHARAAAEGERASLEAIVEAVKDDVYNLAMRMLGMPADAEDATQEVLIQVLTHVGSFRGDSSLRTWVWKIATRHFLKMKRSRYEMGISFDSIEALLDAGEGMRAPELGEAEVARLAEEVRLGCTHAMLLALDREHRVAYLLGDVLGFRSDEAAAILELEPAAFRKRLQRGRQRLGGFMRRKCGLVDPVAACRCVRQIPVLESRGLLDRGRLIYRDHPRHDPSALAGAWQELRALDASVREMRDRPRYAAPERLVSLVRQLLDGKQLLQ
jgi:RNA polymerase sigma factor (sigma-70 family)